MPDDKQDEAPFYRLEKLPKSTLWTVERLAGKRKERLKVPDTYEMMFAKASACLGGHPPDQKFWEVVRDGR